MVNSGNRLPGRLLLVASIVLLVAMSGTSARSNENNCRRLEDLARQYAGVQLTSQQQKLNLRLVAWYKRNCKRMESAYVKG
jgi:hypothetical protein